MSKILDKLKAMLFKEAPPSPLDAVTYKQVWSLVMEAEETAASQAGLWGNWQAVPRLFVKSAQDSLGITEYEAEQLWNQSRTQDCVMRLARIQGCAAAHLPLFPVHACRKEPQQPMNMVGDIIIN